MFKTILIEINGSTSIIRINRPEALNALNREVFQDLHAYLESVTTDPSIRCILITGAGEKSFVAGADITEFNAIGAGEAKAFLQAGNDVMNMIEQYHIPVIAVISGFALGGGCELAMACHMRIAGEKARFGMPEINLGILPGYGGTQRLPHLIGKAKSMELMLTGDMINAQQALSLGLVNEVVPDGKEMERAIEMAHKLSSKAPIAIRAVIDAINNSNPDLIKGIGHESDLFTALADTTDFKEGTNAFLEKRKAIFIGK